VTVAEVLAIKAYVPVGPVVDDAVGGEGAHGHGGAVGAEGELLAALVVVIVALEDQVDLLGHQQVEQVHRQRRVHEELRRVRRLPRTACERVGVGEDDVLVDVKVEVRRAPAEAVEAERRAERRGDGHPDECRAPADVVRDGQIRLRRNDQM